MSTRGERRALVREMRKRAEAYPRRLTLIPEEQWPPPRPGMERPAAVWRGSQYLAQLYVEPLFLGRELRRLTVNRVTMRADGHWDQNIPWDDLQRCKREAGYGDWYAVEVYPRDRDLVCDANMRHLWLLEQPLAIGWFSAVSSPANPKG